jgi:membrane dipeptidase
MLLGGGAALGALAALGGAARAARGDQAPTAGSAPAPLWAGYPNAVVIDGLCGLDLGDALPLPDDVLAVVDRCGMTAINMTVPQPKEGFEGAVRRFARLQRAAEVHAEHLLLVRTAADLQRAKGEAKLGIIAGAQSTDLYGEDLDRIDLFRGLGLRIAQLTYNDRSLYGDGCLEPGNAGLSRLGHQAVERMNGLGIAVDLSHAGQRTTAEGIAASKRPPLISHTGCNAVYRHPRNNDDAELRAAADKGGVVGIYLMPFLDGGTGELTTDMLFAHLDHALDVCGEDHVGIGSDQGVVPVADGPEYRKALREEVEQRKAMGISAPGESPDRPPFIPALNSERHMDRIAAAMSRRGRPDRVIEKVVGANFARAFAECWTA